LLLFTSQRTAYDEAQPKANTVPTELGNKLKGYRKRKKMSARTLSKELDVSHVTIGCWESGYTPLPPVRIPALSRALGLSQEEREEIEAIATVKKLDHPALDPEWLQEQPVSKRAGLLLTAYRERSALGQRELGSALGIGHDIIGDWERGNFNIRQDKFSAIGKALNLSPQEQERLEAEAQARRDYVSIPDDKELNKQPAALRFGILLAAFRQRAKLLQRELGDKLGGVSEITVNVWENGRKLPTSPPEVLADALNLSPGESEMLVRNIETSRLAMKANRIQQGATLSRVKAIAKKLDKAPPEVGGIH